MGCGVGDSWNKMKEDAEKWQVVGLDVHSPSLHMARASNGERGWRYLCARGEEIPLPSGSVDGVLCNVALPYMHIPRTLTELHRVLVPGGWLRASLHLPSFTRSEFRRSFPKPKAILFRLFVFANGMVLHCFGRVVSIKNVAESCQTERGMRIALRGAGFEQIGFRYEGARFFVEARRCDRTAHILEQREMFEVA